ncbi:MAG TPA: MBL fold metallo-hydrolase, partial [Anaerolineae bacterium]|nr:MBL fold metallo-hydrolase [Anaerolineae bacterium]
MRLTFLGTAAANAFPEPFCGCDNCVAAWAEGGRSLRRRTAALVNDDLLLDLGPDIMTASHSHGVSLGKVGYCLLTHPHADHMDLSHLQSRSPGFGTVGAPLLHLYASAETLTRADRTFRRDLAGFGLLDGIAEAELNMRVHELRPSERVMIGEYEVIPLRANHAPGLGAFLYAIRREGKAIFYGTDTAALFDEVWAAFKRFELVFDLVVLDQTYGPEEAT